jgi:hypothetical protein
VQGHNHAMAANSQLASRWLRRQVQAGELAADGTVGRCRHMNSAGTHSPDPRYCSALISSAAADPTRLMCVASILMSACGCKQGRGPKTQ